MRAKAKDDSRSSVRSSVTLYLETAHQILMIFCHMLDTIALNNLTLVLCTKKLVPSLGGYFYPPKLKNPPHVMGDFLKICTLSNLMVLNSFLVLF